MTIPAIFENGVFRPLEKVSLPDQTRVLIELAPGPRNAEENEVSRRWSLHLVESIADDFDETPPEFEAYM